MTSFESERIYDANGWVVWRLLSEHLDVNSWMPGVIKIATRPETSTPGRESPVLGTTGEATTPRKRQWHQQYRVTSRSEPAWTYTAEVAVEALKESRSLVRWRASFNPEDTSDEDATAVVDGVFEGGVKRIDELLQNSNPVTDTTAPATSLKLSHEERDRVFMPILDSLARDGAEERYMFGQRGLVSQGHLFATMFNASFVARLVAGTPEYDEALALPGSVIWNPTHGKKPFSDWIQISMNHQASWLSYARVALGRAGSRTR